MMDSELPPCPKCGKKAQTFMYAGTRKRLGWAIACSDCPFEFGPFDARSHAIECWEATCKTMRFIKSLEEKANRTVFVGTEEEED